MLFLSEEKEKILTKSFLNHQYTFLQKSIRKISKEFNISSSVIHRRLKLNKIKTRGRELVRSEETRQKIANAHKGKKRSEESRKKQANSIKGENNPFYGKKHKKESIDKIKKNMPDFSGMNNPMYGIHLSKELSYNWQNGKSFEIYPQEFNKDLKKQILKRDNYTCQNPNCEELHDKLHIHHIDYNKKNNNPENLIVLGDSCHSKTSGKNNRQYWTEFYQNIMMNKLMECLL